MDPHLYKICLAAVLCLCLGALQCGTGLGPSGGGGSAGGGDGSGGGESTAATLGLSTASPALAAKGVTLTLQGSHFASGMTVTVGGVACTPVTIVSAVQATCVAGARAMGTVDVVVARGSETAALGGGFTYRHYLYVADDTPGQVWAFAVSPTTGNVTAVAGSPFSVVAGAHFLAMDPLGKYLFVLGSDPQTLTSYVVDPVTGALGASASLGLGVDRGFLAIDPTGKFAFLGSSVNGTDSEITSVGINRATDTLSLVGNAGTARENRAILVSSDGLHAYSYTANGVIAIYSIDATNGAQTELGASPFSTTNFVHSAVFTANGLNGFFSSPTSNLIIGFNRAASGELSNRTDSVVVNSGSSPVSLALHPTLRVLYDVDEGGSTVTTYAWPSGTGVSSIDTQVVVDGVVQQFVIEPSGSFAFSRERSADRLRVRPLDATTGIPGAPINVGALGASPRYLVID